MGNYLLDAGVFLLDTLVSLYILAVLLRFLLQLARADFFNPVAQFLVMVTTPTLKPLRRFIPGLWGIDLAAVALLLLLEGLLVFLVGPGGHPMLQLGLVFGQPPRVAGLIVLTVTELLKTTLYVYLFIIALRAILSWVSPYPNPNVRPLVQMSEPLLRRVRTLLPAAAGLDLSPFVAGLILVLLLMVPIRMLTDLGILLAR